jgi:DNA polymerase elongation subunit (family B)
MDTCFNPYFYIDKELEDIGDIKSIDGNSVKKINCNNPGDVRNERLKHKKTYEADVRYTNRYIIDKLENYDKIKEPIRICYIDIEIARTEAGYESYEVANNPILCIGCYDNFDKEYKQFIVDENTLEDEKIMLNEFLDYLQTTNPDLFVAWNGDKFDFPFLINRLKKLKLDEKRLSRNNGSSIISDFGVKLFGRVPFDLMKGYKKIVGEERESWSLDYITKYELGDKGGKEVYKGQLDDLFKNNRQKFLDYNKRDVELMVMLNEKLRIVDFFDEVRRLCYCKIEDVFMNSKIADCLCLHYAKGKYVLPTSVQNPDNRIVGAFVKESEPGLHKMVSVMDMKSLYPSIIIGFNISAETLIKK